jgi:type II secretion system protein H
MFRTGSFRVGMSRDAPIGNAGLTLLELVLVAAIIAVLAAIAVPRYGSASVRYQVDLAARRVAADLREAQMYAKTAGTSRTVVFSAGTDSYQLVNVPAPDGAPGHYTVDLSAQPYRAQLTSVDFNGDNLVVFSGWGLPDTGGTVVVTVGSEQRTIVLDGESGQASVQ